MRKVMSTLLWLDESSFSGDFIISYLLCGFTGWFLTELSLYMHQIIMNDISISWQKLQLKGVGSLMAISCQPVSCKNCIKFPKITFIIFFSGTSKPRPLFRWLEDHHVIREANRTQVEQGDFGGEKLTSLIEFRAGPEHNEKIFSCFAHNPTIEPQVELNATITLVVLCKYLLFKS